jgi:Staphylococcal nuclease homologue
MGDIAPSERHRYPSLPASLRRLDEGVAVDARRGVDEELERMLMLYATRIIDSGTMLLAALEALIAGVKVRCEVVERDRHGRLVAKVFAPNRVDIGRRLVLAGWALAYRRYS